MDFDEQSNQPVAVAMHAQRFSSGHSLTCQHMHATGLFYIEACSLQSTYLRCTVVGFLRSGDIIMLLYESLTIRPSMNFTEERLSSSLERRYGPEKLRRRLKLA